MEMLHAIGNLIDPPALAHLPAAASVHE